MRNVVYRAGRARNLRFARFGGSPRQTGMEEALQDAFDGGRIEFPVIAVEFPSDGLLDEIGTITSLSGSTPVSPDRDTARQ